MVSLSNNLRTSSQMKLFSLPFFDLSGNSIFYSLPSVHRPFHH
jgi:hypothetical protein